MNTIEVCLSPQLAFLHSFEGKTAVIVDILRATSCFVTGLANEIRSIRAVSTVDECNHWKDRGYIGAAERGGRKVGGFELGNSPFEYMDDSLIGKRVVATTTNGTLAVDKSLKAEKIILASFLNITAVANNLRSETRDVIIICAGWEGQVNLEDTVFAGSLVNKLLATHLLEGDTAILSSDSYHASKDNFAKSLLAGDHAQRLAGMNLHKDIEYCFKLDLYDIVPEMKNGEFMV